MTRPDFTALLLRISLALLLTFVPVIASAQGRNCAPREVIVGQLTDRYGETRQSIGIAANNMVMELFASSQTGTWTIAVTNVAGISCLVASGQAFEALTEALPEGDPL